MSIRNALACAVSVVGTACSSAPAAPVVSAPEPSTRAAELPEDSALDTDALRASLAPKKLSGFVRLSPQVKLHATREAAAAALTPRRLEPKASESTRARAPNDLARVVEDLDGVLRITTKVGREAPIASIDATFEIEAFVRRDALMPVLVEVKSKVLPDGTAYSLAPGLLVGRRGRAIELAEPLLEGVPATFSSADVGLSFEPKALPTLPKLEPVAELGCKRSKTAEGMEVELLEELARRDQLERPDKGTYSFAADPQLQFSCSLEGKAGFLMGGEPWSGARNVGSCHMFYPSVRAYRVRSSVLLDVRLSLAHLRVKPQDAEWVSSGGCGEGMAGSGRPIRLFAKSGTPVFFASGAAAGTYVGTGYSVAAPGATGRVCVDVEHVEGGLCFEASDLIEQQSPY